VEYKCNVKIWIRPLEYLTKEMVAKNKPKPLSLSSRGGHVATLGWSMMVST